MPCSEPKPMAIGVGLEICTTKKCIQTICGGTVA